VSYAPLSVLLICVITTCFLALFVHFKISIGLIIRSLRATKSRTQDYNRAKFALNFQLAVASFPFVHKLVLDKNKNIYNLMANGAKAFSCYICVTLFVCCFFSHSCTK